MWRLFNFSGRTSRLGFWRVQLICVLVSGATTALTAVAIPIVGQIGGVIFLVMAPTVVIDVAVFLRRLHDRGKNVWWLLLFSLGPLLLEGLALPLAEKGTVASATASAPLALAGLGLNIWAWIECGFLRGQPASNRFGEPPAPGSMAPGA